MNIHYDVTGLVSAVWKVTLRSTCLGCLSWHLYYQLLKVKYASILKH